MMEKKINKSVPLSLVKTWITLARSDETDQIVKSRALSMLTEKIGSPQEVAAYMSKHGIK